MSGAQWFDYFNWYNQNVSSKVTLVDVEERKFNDSTKRNTTNCATIKISSNHNVILKQFRNNNAKENHYYEVESAVYESDFGLSPKLILADSNFQVLIIEKISSEDIIKDFNRDNHQHKLSKGKVFDRFLVTLGEGLAQYHNLKPNIKKTEQNSCLEISNGKEYVESLQNLLNSNVTEKWCHNDLKLNNMIFSNEITKLIDFEMSSWRNPYYDYAAIFKLFIFELQVYDPYFFSKPLNTSPVKLKFYSQCVTRVFQSYFGIIDGIDKLNLDPKLIKAALTILLIDYSTEKYFFNNLDFITSWLP